MAIRPKINWAKEREEKARIAWAQEQMLKDQNRGINIHSEEYAQKLDKLELAEFGNNLYEPSPLKDDLKIGMADPLPPIEDDEPLTEEQLKEKQKNQPGSSPRTPFPYQDAGLNRDMKIAMGRRLNLGGGRYLEEDDIPILRNSYQNLKRLGRYREMQDMERLYPMKVLDPA